MPSTADVTVRGPQAFVKAVQAADNNTRRALDTACRKAGELVAQDARRRVPTRTGHAAGTVRALDGHITAGGPRAPYFGWLDFGGRVGRKRSVRRPTVTGGRYVYRALSAEKARMLNMLDGELETLTDQAGLT